MSGFRVIKIVIEQELKRFNGSGLLVRLMRPYLLEMVQMNICELLLSAFGIWHVESEDAKNRPLCFLTSEFLASITVSPHIRRKHQTIM